VTDTAPEKPHRCLSHLHWFARDRDLAWEHAWLAVQKLGGTSRVATWLWNVRSLEGSSVMSELDVTVIHIRAEQAAEYERLFAERELPRWREYKARGAFLSARISRVAFGTDDRNDVAKYVIAVEVPGHAAHPEHDADPGFQEFNRLADLLQPEDPLVYGGEVLHAV